MSSIPSSAMPHAGPATTDAQDSQDSGLTATLGSITEQITDTVREYPKTAAAAGAAVVVGAGLVAARAIRGRSSTSSRSSGSGSKGSGKSSRKSS